eukprot:CAMPEP_0173456500 /NCGR_PEP_ID=MMETSP1357-20121228/56126_1 /TAXON_ID=77926 /ORGANISM="Hemiselmis rufescens, Strain PCC563" /LENGTH=220 /DNA_ID=CAMNT_0014423729 /DNA_START=35 /DNA_END=697 /DNA_ORIENTATION=+
MTERALVIGGRAVKVRQTWERRSEDDLEPTGMRWTGAAVWDAAIVLSEFLAANKQLIHRKRVLEVGAGLALVSVAAGMFGAESVTATDYSTSVLDLAQNNMEANIPDMAVSGNATAMPLLWGSEEAAQSLGGPFDVVVGSDVIYREDVFKPLIETLDLTTTNDSIVILAHKPRGLSEEKFFFWLRRKFVVLQEHQPTELHKDFVTAGVKVHVLRKKQSFE